ncbi:AAA family ATPase [Nocardiopsis alkaliphila]|uniref:AAA family ATPase n=1 Tax=Nocardiopsis alkaliphila TaxID=225762 RepID=UPI001268DB51|nr:AAA family ATPase [Nocardiopsis alkaliphila]
MIIAPLRMTDPWFHRLARNDEADAQTLNGVSCDIAVRMETVSILHHDADQNYRPYLHLRGQLTRIRPDVVLPHGITELRFRSGSEPTIDAFYEFDTDQLSELVRKGYFGPRFRVPDSMIGIMWELPAEADLLVIAPEDVDQPPLVFVDVREQNSAVLTEENSGYALAEYFPDYSIENSEQMVAEAQTAVPTHSEQIQDLFADEELDETPHGRAGFSRRDVPSGQSAMEPLPKGAFDRLLEEVEARRRVEEAAKKPGVDYVPDSPEGLLRERITPAVEQALVDRLERRTEHVVEVDPDFDGFLDLDVEDEDGVR